jgi:cell division protein FtsL
MVKLLICLLSATVLGFFILELRQQQLELGHQTAQLHEQIKSQQGKLWNQQLQIAVFTAPNAIEKTVKGQQIDMIPVFSIKPEQKPVESDQDAD